MDEVQAEKIIDYVFKEVFGVDNPLIIEQAKEKFAYDIPLPQKVKCSLTGVDTWISFYKGEKIATIDAIAEQFNKNEWMREKRTVNSIEDTLSYWQEINYITAQKNINCKNVAQSDIIFGSSFVYRSNSVLDSKNIIFCYKVDDCNYMVASRDASSCTLGIRTKESIFCSSSFEVSWSSKVSKSMFIHDCYDLYECLFCSHLRSKRYCIANMQFGKEEYLKIKKTIIGWILNKYCNYPPFSLS